MEMYCLESIGAESLNLAGVSCKAEIAVYKTCNLIPTLFIEKLAVSSTLE
jgi:hypothetical protein